MKKYFMMGNAHLDPVWQWRVPEGLALVKSTFKSALDRMEQFPEYKFTSACAGYYQWIKFSEPEMFEKIKKRIEEGRWNFTGGMWVQPDCNIPCGEAFARHLLYSQKFFEENFEKKAETGYNVDSFGHNGMLPQIFSKSGIKNYIYMRPSRNGEKPNLPECNLHWWESPDNSRVLAFRILDGYGDDLRAERIKRYESQKNSQILSYGIGNHGGGPSIETLKQAQKLIEENDNFQFACADEYFEYVRANETEDLPVVKEDLQHHASGCYSANSKIKKLNRRAEDELVYAEKIDIMSSILTKCQPKTERIENAWQRVMFNQFHDILAGCSIKPAYDDAYSAFGYARETALEVGTFAAERISWRINTTKFLEKPSTMRDRVWIKEGEGCPMVVFNPHSFPVSGNAYFGMQWVSGVVDSDDNDVEYQIVRAPYTDNRHKNMCMFKVDLPAYGYGVYYIFKDEQNYQPESRQNQFVVTQRTLENSVVRVEFDENGSVKSYFNKLENKEYCSAPFKTVVCNDEKNDTWGHQVYDYNIYVGEFSQAEFTVVEQGTLRATLKVVTRYGNSSLEQYFSLYKDSPELEVKCRLNFKEPYRIVKMTFPVNVKQPRAIYSMPFGFIEKECDGLEEPAHKWISNGEIALINNCKYSFCVKDNEMRMIVARTCAYLDHFGQDYRDDEMCFHDMDELEFSYKLLPYDKISEVVKEAEIFNTPLQLYQETHHGGELPPVYSGLTVNCDNVIVSAIKLAENGSGYIIRAYECGGENAEAEFDFKLLNRKFSFNFAPQEIKTIFIPLSDGNVEEVLITE
ncbi:MAG: alpha-mannosidase [Ruminococcus sp.]|nr:alpha-mannosidase [Candidatus Copronaster equi]